jgi:hypothetical protein
MILWTIQTQAAVEALARRGELVADGGEPEPGFERAYGWMSARMTGRLGAAPPGARPIWAWHTWQSGRERPDLRSREHLPSGTRGARIELEIDPGRVLLSDFSLWHFALNYWYLPSSPADEESFEALLRAAGLDPYRTKPLPDPAFHARMEESWDRIFDLESVIEGVTDEPGQRCVQATLWRVPVCAVRGITRFVAR